MCYMHTFYFRVDYRKYEVALMLKEEEISSLAKTLRLDKEITRNCVKDLFLKNSPVIDGKIVKKKVVGEFLRVCIQFRTLKGKEKEYPLVITGEVIKFFYDNFKSLDPIKTLLYFFKDSFFAPVLFYLDQIYLCDLVYPYPKNFKFSRQHGLSNFYCLLTDLGYFNYLDNSESKTHTIGTLVEIYAASTDLDIDEYALSVAPDLINQIGYRIFAASIFRDSIVNSENMRRDRGLNLITSSLGKYRAARNKKKNYFIYCLCQRLYDENYGRRKSFKIVAEGLSLPSGTVHRRFYDVEKEMKQRGISYRGLIQLRYKELFNERDKLTIDAMLHGLKSQKNIDEFIS